MINTATQQSLGAARWTTPTSDAKAAVACFHCGEPCKDSSFSKAEKAFCCQGCMVVHDLLTESGLDQFYELTSHPGIQMRRAARSEQWAFLDDAAMQQRLLDFTDGTQSRVTFHIPAIHCVACVWLLENLFRLNPGVGRSQVNFSKREVAISFATQKLKLSELVALLASIGYEPTLTFGELEKRTVSPARKRHWLQIGLAGFAFGNIMLFSLPQYFGLDSFSGPAFKTLFGWLSLVLALPVVTYSALDYWKSAWLAVRQRVATLDVPIALGLAAIYGQSVYEIVSRTGEGYFDSLCGLIFFLLCGRAFQQKTQERLAFDRDYKSFFPLSVVCKSADAKEERVSLAQLSIGDRIVLRNGEIIPADARLISGPAFVDYSFVTGESEPLAKAEGDYLYAGGQQVGAAIEVETVKAVSQSYLTSLWNHETFQKNRDDGLNSLTNLYSRRFIWIVISIAFASIVFWAARGDAVRGLKAFTSVLIVACPCALALAAPFTLGTAQRWLAKANAFLKNVLVLERMARVDAIVFDKTGTLTSAGVNAVRFVGASFPLTPALSLGERENLFPRSEEIQSVGSRASTSQSRQSQSWGEMISDRGNAFLLPRGEGQGEGKASAINSTGVPQSLTATEQNWIYSLTRHSTHPHSARINESLGEKHIASEVQDFRETVGCGIEGKVDGREIWLGSRAWLQSRSVSIPQEETPTNGGIVHLAIDGYYRGAFILSSSLRSEADTLIQQLGLHYELALLSGDNERERERFSALFGGHARLNFNQTPLDKLGFIRRLQDSGKTVMMVGDGLNDAGALKQSDVGVAVVEKVGAFSPASDVILDAKRVPELFRMLKFAKRATRIVRLSFAISSAYNVIGVSIAAAGLLSPIVCAVLMPLSSASVVLFACGVTSWSARGLITKPETSNPKSETVAA